MSNAAKKFDILATSLSILHHYFDLIIWFDDFAYYHVIDRACRHRDEAPRKRDSASGYIVPVARERTPGVADTADRNVPRR